jgi:type II restriction enzyme
MDKQQPSDFQPLSKAVNGAKRTHCNRCKDTGFRFDAKLLGYSESFLQGDQKSKTCVGCYWYDPHKFNQVISKDFEKKY